ncbi:MAG: hypothetical protein ABWY00_03010, partial [Dongiaceae bacterium]
MLLLVYPHLATPFFIVQVGAQTLYLGVIALSLMFLAGYGGMVSLSQMTVAGVAGYAVAVFGTNSTHPLFGWPLWAAGGKTKNQNPPHTTPKKHQKKKNPPPK